MHQSLWAARHMIQLVGLFPAVRLQQCASDARAAAHADPSAGSTLLWTHAMNAYAAAAAGDAGDVEATCRAMVRDTRAASLGGALRSCPAGDYPRWLASFFHAAVRTARRGCAARRDDVAPRQRLREAVGARAHPARRAPRRRRPEGGTAGACQHPRLLVTLMKFAGFDFVAARAR